MGEIEISKDSIIIFNFFQPSFVIAVIVWEYQEFSEKKNHAIFLSNSDTVLMLILMVDAEQHS